MTTSIERVRVWTCRAITMMLSIAAVTAVCWGIWAAIGPADTQPFESPLMLSVARQLDLGPWALYGPYGRQNPLVLIHAPLYYQLAAMVARLLHTTGMDPITAARLAGRALSFAGLLLAGWSAFRIARLDGASAKAGWWAACLLASAPVVGTVPFTVRSDMFGVGLQTTGVWLILSALRSRRKQVLTAVGGFAAFGLAICVKQHFVGGPLVATSLLFWGYWRGKVAWRAAAGGVLTAGVIVVAFYFVEELATGGRMSEAVFFAAAAAPRVHPAGWVRGAIVLGNIVGGTSCLIALLTLACVAHVAATGGKRGVAVAIGGMVVAGGALLLPVVQQFRPGVLTSLAAATAPLVCVFVIVPICVGVDRSALVASKFDAKLCLFLAVEIAIVVPLCLASTGAWVNYAIQGVVFAAILTGRSMARACETARQLIPLVAITLAAFALVCFEIKETHGHYVRTQFERLRSEMVVRNLSEPTRDLFFADDPGRNRQFGRTDLVFDHWLYPVFESLRLAEPRSVWLRSTLTDGSVRFVVTTSSDARIDGVREPLTKLGYHGRFEVGSLYVWEQVSVLRVRADNGIRSQSEGRLYPRGRTGGGDRRRHPLE